MRLSLITVSYLNDNNYHVEWLHPFYASLKNELFSEDVTVEHFIILNDGDKVQAKNNIERVVSEYDLDFYSIRFVPVVVKPALKKSGSSHHGAALNEGIDLISDNYGDTLNNSDLILFEEFDTIHKESYYSTLREMCCLSESYETFFGKVDPGTLKLSEKKVSRDENLGMITEPRGEIESKNGDLYFWTPRILPHFFGFHSNLFNSFALKKSGFRDEITDYASHHSIENTSGEVTLYNDTGSDLFKEIFKEERFFHINDLDFLCHIKNITYLYEKILNTPNVPYFDKKDLLAKVKNKFNFVRFKFDYLPFSKSSLFYEDSFDQNIL